MPNVITFLLTRLNSIVRGRKSGQLDHINRRKTPLELVRLSAAVMGIELCYAAETAFVSPTLLNMGLPHNYMSLIWCLSPILGFFLTPLLGSLSDRCTLSFGRRRPFILLLSLGILLGLILVPNGASLGTALGDTHNSSTWSASLTILGTVLLDFNSDACQSPARAYLLDNTLPEDQVIGLSTFTVMAGLGGTFGYAMGAVDWNGTWFGQRMGGQVRSVFSIISIVYVICVTVTVTSFREVPPITTSSDGYERFRDDDEDASSTTYGAVNETSFGVVPATDADDELLTKVSSQPELRSLETKGIEGGAKDDERPLPEMTLRRYLSSIIHMPTALTVLCLTNFFSWMSLVSYSLYFTDFVGEAIFDGDPKAELESPLRSRYEDGVRFGCLGMSVYSFSCSVYSKNIKKLIQKFGNFMVAGVRDVVVQLLLKKTTSEGLKRVYVGGHLVYCVGMVLMGLLRHRIAVLLLSCTAGVMYATLFTMPYLLVAKYHNAKTFSDKDSIVGANKKWERGLGTDVAVVNSMIFLAQFSLSSCMGSVVYLAGSTVAIVFAASIISFCGAISAIFVTYIKD